jgi:hypothetical protein
MESLHPIAPQFVRHQQIGKPRRAVGDPVAPLKENTRFIPVPHPVPAHLTLPFDVIDPKRCAAAEKAGRLVFHAVGDTGGVHGTATQEAIATAMEEQIKTSDPGHAPAFFYDLGDVIYFNGQRRLYKTEFYEPYQYYPALIFAVPGNHDGDTHVQKGDLPDHEPSLSGFFDNFCDAHPRYVSPYRMSMTQPYVYWTLDAPFVTVIGLYSNVEGSLDARGRYEQQQFLLTQLSSAPKDKKVIVAVHHPPFSLDIPHGGAYDVLNALDRAFSKSGRYADAVLSGHVHNYQRFSRNVQGRSIPYVVAGAGGYANDKKSLHKLQNEIQALPKSKLPYQTTHPDVKLEAFNDAEPGFLRLTVDAKHIKIEYFLVPFDEGPVQPFDSVVV